MTVRPKVVIAGGGFGGLETAFMLRIRMHDDVDISLASDRDSFLFKPNTIYIPFGADPPCSRRRPAGTVLFDDDDEHLLTMAGVGQVHGEALIEGDAPDQVAYWNKHEMDSGPAPGRDTISTRARNKMLSVLSDTV